jgi:ribose-phosphate pyrophosphokinase
MEIKKYPDNSGYVIENDFNREVVFRLNNYEDLWYLNQYVDVCNHNGYTPTVVIPNLIDAQADRRFNKNESSGLKLVCEFLNKMKANFKIFHPHNPEVVEALMNNVEILDNFFFIKSVLAQIENKDNLILMSSDAGGFKPLMKLCDKINWQGDTLSAVKHRYWNHITQKSELTQLLTVKDLEGKDVLIIDDICVYGGTFKGLSKLLKSRNCGKLYLAVSHMTVQELGVDPVTNYFDKVFVTNSKYDAYHVYDDVENPITGSHIPKNLEIIKIF